MSTPESRESPQSPQSPESDAVPSEPFLRVVSGSPTPDELAAVTVALAALARSGAQPATPPPAGGWTDLSLRIRRMPAPGPGAWRSAT